MNFNKSRKNHDTFFNLFLLIKYLTVATLLLVVIYVPSRLVVFHIQNRIDYSDCINLSENIKRINCLKSLIKRTVKQGNLSYSVDLMKTALKEDQGDCHSLAHQLGRDFYLSLKRGGFVRIGDPMTVCGYGFWHGFMGAVVMDTNPTDLGLICNKMLNKNKSLYGECYHGFGLGFVGDPPVQELQGKAKETVYSSIKMCDNLTQEAGYKNDCYTGVFHQMLSYIKNSEYKYVLDHDEIFGFCGSFEDELKRACLLQFAPALSALTGYSFDKLFVLFEANYSKIDDNTKDQMIYSMVAGKVNESSDEEIKTYMKYCFSKQGIYKSSCINGIFGGIFIKSKEGEIAAINKMIRTCNESSIDSDQKQVCLEYVSTTAKNYKNLNKDLINFCKEQTVIKC